jgi:hypothetical protein
LWEINGIPSPRVKKDLEDKNEVRSREKVARLPHLSDPSYTPFSEVKTYLNFFSFFGISYIHVNFTLN